MTNSQYAAFAALDPFFDIVMQGLAGVVDGDHYFEAIAADAVFEYRYVFPGFPTKVEARRCHGALFRIRRQHHPCHGRRARPQAPRRRMPPPS